MNREYNSRVSSKNSERLLRNLQNTTGDYFFLPHPVDQAGTGVRCYISARQTFRLQLPGGSTFLSEMTS